MDLHARLAADCHVLGTTDLGTLLLHKNASLPWFILVPDTQESALYALPDEQQVQVQAQWNCIAQWVHKRYACTRVNMAAIGNLVPQLHLHIVARNEKDPCWPGVVWGQTLPEAYWQTGELASLQDELQELIALEVSVLD